MANPKLGTKRIDPETGRKFYDLNKDPIVSPYSGVAYPRSYFDSASISPVEEEDEVEEREAETEEEGADVVSLEEADEETKGGELPELGDEDVDLSSDDDDTFLEDEEEEEDDVADIVGVGDDEEP